jgi:membrane protease YdiL (CAAX protease family)
MRWPPKAITGSLLVIIAYMLIRAGVYELFPVTSLESWFTRDAVTCLPRLAAFAALIYLNRHWQLVRFDFPAKDFGHLALWGSLPLALWMFYFSGSRGDSFAPWMIALGFVTSMVVGLFEEYAFRGPLLAALSRRYSLFTAAFLSTLVFTLCHFQAQPVAAWGNIFLTGIIMANLRLRGLSLGSLALLHGLIDASYFLFREYSADLSNFHGLTLQIGLFAYALWSRPQATSPLPE